MVGVQKTWSTSHNYSDSCRTSSCGYCKVHLIIIILLEYLPFRRLLRKFQNKHVTVAKLFAKHIKVQDAAKFLRSTRTGMAVGTPTRLNDLMDNGIYKDNLLAGAISDNVNRSFNS